MKGIFRLVLVLALICLISGFALSAVYQATKEPIAYQKRLEMIRSLQAVLPGLSVDPDKLFLDLPAENGQTVRVYRAPGDSGIAGVAFQVVANDGYSGNIEVMVGVLPDGSLGGIEILSHAETPGLGSLIIEESWKGQFKGRSLSNTDFRVKKDGGEIDQITGATISPRAVTGAVARGLSWYGKNAERILSTEGSSS